MLHAATDGSFIIGPPRTTCMHGGVFLPVTEDLPSDLFTWLVPKHAQLPTTTMASTNNTNDTAASKQQVVPLSAEENATKYIKLICHALSCSRSTCGTLKCAHMKQALDHIINHRIAGNIEYKAIRDIAIHYLLCQDPECRVCKPVNEAGEAEPSGSQEQQAGSGSGSASALRGRKGSRSRSKRAGGGSSSDSGSGSESDNKFTKSAKAKAKARAEAEAEAGGDEDSVPSFKVICYHALDSFLRKDRTVRELVVCFLPDGLVVPSPVAPYRLVVPPLHGL
jgi:TAZ zinc finger